jgi:hypothetical protein
MVLSSFFLRGKFFALFSLLFGWSFFIQFDNARKRNTDYRGRYLWRIFLLFVIGYVHHCFYRGDILTIYAMLAPFLILFLPLSNKWLWAGIGIIFLGIPRIILFQTIGDGSIFGGPAMDFEGPEVQQYWQVLKNGTLPEVLYSNATDGFAMKMEFQLGLIYRFYLTFAFFLFGAWLGRIRYFDQFEKYKSGYPLGVDRFHHWVLCFRRFDRRVLHAGGTGIFLWQPLGCRWLAHGRSAESLPDPHHPGRVCFYLSHQARAKHLPYFQRIWPYGIDQLCFSIHHWNQYSVWMGIRTDWGMAEYSSVYFFLSDHCLADHREQNLDEDIPLWSFGMGMEEFDLFQEDIDGGHCHRLYPVFNRLASA